MRKVSTCLRRARVDVVLARVFVELVRFIEISNKINTEQQTASMHSALCMCT